MTGDPSALAQKNSESPKGFAALFRNRHFMCLWIAQIFSQFSDRAVFVLFVAVLSLNRAYEVHSEHAGVAQGVEGIGSAQLTSLLYVAFTIPAVVLSPVAGVYVDRWSNKAVLIISNLFRAACVTLVALPMVRQSVIASFFIAFLISIGSQFFGPAETSSIPRLVKSDELYSANSLFFTTMMIALGFGFAIGGPIIEQTGIKGAPWAVAGGFFVAAILLIGLPGQKRNERTNDAWWEELRSGLAYIVDNPVVFRAILKITLLFSTIITLNIVAVGLAEQVMKIDAYRFGYVVAAAGLGMGLGNFWVGHNGEKYNSSVLVYGGFAALGLFMSLLGSLGYMQMFLFPMLGWHDIYFRGYLMSVPLFLAMMTGFSCAFVAVPTQAALQAAVPEELRGKVFGAQNTAMSAASTIPVILTGVSADNLPGGVSTTLFILGIPTLLIGFYYLQRNLAKQGLVAKSVTSDNS